MTQAKSSFKIQFCATLSKSCWIRFIWFYLVTSAGCKPTIFAQFCQYMYFEHVWETLKSDSSRKQNKKNPQNYSSIWFISPVHISNEFWFLKNTLNSLKLAAVTQVSQLRILIVVHRITFAKWFFILPHTIKKCWTHLKWNVISCNYIILVW